MSATFSSVSALSSTVRVIVVEDNVGLIDEMVFFLNSAGFRVRGASDGRQLDALLDEEAADIVLLDVNLPFESGHQIARRLASRAEVGIIMLTGESQLGDKLQGLESGADLYLVKPIDPLELVACINSLWRRIQPVAQDISWQLDAETRRLIAPTGSALCLTPQDIKLLQLLQSSPGEVFNRQQMIQALDIEFIHEPDARINMMVSRLRQKLCKFDPTLGIQTWRNFGYSYIGPKIEHRA